MGFVMLLINVVVVVFLLMLLVRFVNAVEKAATASENQERQVGRLATAVEKLSLSQGGGIAPNNSPNEG